VGGEKWREVLAGKVIVEVWSDVYVDFSSALEVWWLERLDVLRQVSRLGLDSNGVLQYFQASSSFFNLISDDILTIPSDKPHFTTLARPRHGFISGMSGLRS
jgi:hypothetical protein